MNKITSFSKVEKGKGFTSAKTGEPWWFWNLTDTEGDKYSIPSYSITFAPEEGKEYDIDFTVEKNGKWVNRKITKMFSPRTENMKSTNLEVENNSLLQEIANGVSRLVELAEKNRRKYGEAAIEQDPFE